MRRSTMIIIGFLACICSTTCSAGHVERFGYPAKDLVYKFEFATGAADQWDSAAKEVPPLAPGKASQAAKKFVRTVPLRDDMKEWDLRTITLMRISPALEEWVYVVHFDAVPK